LRSAAVEQLVARPSLRRGRWVLVGSGIFAAVCLWALLTGGWQSIWPEAGLLLFGVGGLNYVRVVRSGEPWVTLDETGIGGKGVRRVVRWEEIAELVTSSSQGTQLLGVIPHTGAAEDVLTKPGRFFAGANRALVGAPINFTISRLDVPIEVILDRAMQLAPPTVQIAFDA
jgi:hypothetical protein